MGKLTVVFQGICTHFLSLQGLGIIPDQKVHRVVLINASGENVINGVRIPPHFATIQLSPTTRNPDSQTFSLTGVNLTLGAAGSPPLNYQDYGAVPTLRDQMSDIETLSDPNPSLLFEESWPAVAAYFTVDAGTFSSCVMTGAAVVKLVVDTDEDDDVVTLNATPFPGAPPLPFETVPIQLVSPATITIQNMANAQGELDEPRSHFFLHYLLAERYPAAPQAPLTISGTQCLDDETVSAGCSDSNYP